jgi:hypothetical protein
MTREPCARVLRYGAPATGTVHLEYLAHDALTGTSARAGGRRAGPPGSAEPAVRASTGGAEARVRSG